MFKGAYIPSCSLEVASVVTKGGGQSRAIRLSRLACVGDLVG